MRRISYITWIALCFHLAAFAAITYEWYKQVGFHWLQIPMIFLAPLVAFYNNIKEYSEQKAETND